MLDAGRQCGAWSLWGKIAGNKYNKHRAVNAPGAARIVRQAAAKGVLRFVYLSTAKVYGDATRNGPFDGAGMSDSKDPYTAAKREAEKLLRDVTVETGPEMVILRPPLV